jgi:hypothetical protein
MNMWVSVRLALLLFSAISAFLVPLGPHAKPPIGWGSLLVIFLFCPIGLLAVLGFQVANPRSAVVWRRPSWSINPFNFREPLQFFHLAAYVCLIQGLVGLTRLTLSSTPFYVEVLVPLAMGAGAFIGLHGAMLLFRSKLAEGDTDRR